MAGVQLDHTYSKRNAARDLLDEWYNQNLDADESLKCEIKEVHNYCIPLPENDVTRESQNLRSVQWAKNDVIQEIHNYAIPKPKSKKQVYEEAGNCFMNKYRPTCMDDIIEETHDYPIPNIQENVMGQTTQWTPRSDVTEHCYSPTLDDPNNGEFDQCLNPEWQKKADGDVTRDTHKLGTKLMTDRITEPYNDSKCSCTVGICYVHNYCIIEGENDVSNRQSNVTRNPLSLELGEGDPMSKSYSHLNGSENLPCQFGTTINLPTAGTSCQMASGSHLATSSHDIQENNVSTLPSVINVDHDHNRFCSNLLVENAKHHAHQQNSAMSKLNFTEGAGHAIQYVEQGKRNKLLKRSRGKKRKDVSISECDRKQKSKVLKKANTVKEEFEKKIDASDVHVKEGFCQKDYVGIEETTEMALQVPASEFTATCHKDAPVERTKYNDLGNKLSTQANRMWPVVDFISSHKDISLNDKFEQENELTSNGLRQNLIHENISLKVERKKAKKTNKLTDTSQILGLKEAAVLMKGKVSKKTRNKPKTMTAADQTITAEKLSTNKCQKRRSRTDKNKTVKNVKSENVLDSSRLNICDEKDANKHGQLSAKFTKTKRKKCVKLENVKDKTVKKLRKKCTKVEDKKCKAKTSSEDISFEPTEILPLHLLGARGNPWGEAVPADILCNIFHIDVMNEGAVPFLSRMSRVCRLWNSVAKDHSLWKDVDLSGKLVKKKKKTIIWLCKNRLTHVEKLDLTNWEILTDAELKILTVHCSALRSLILSKCSRFTGRGLQMIADSCSNLQEIDLSAISSFVTQRRPLGVLAEKLGTRLISLTLSWTVLLHFDVVMDNLMEHCPNLEVLDLSNVLFSSFLITLNVEKMQTSWQQLKKLWLTNSMWKLKHLQQGPQNKACQRGFARLEELSLARSISRINKFRFVTDSVIQRFLHGSPDLKSLDITSCRHISNASLSCLPATDLQDLYMSHSLAATENSLTHTIDRWAHSLKELDLTASCLTLQGLQHILDTCMQLQQLHLGTCRGLPRGMRKVYHKDMLNTLRQEVIKCLEEEQ